MIISLTIFLSSTYLCKGRDKFEMTRHYVCQRSAEANVVGDLTYMYLGSKTK